ncbi:MAG: EAL domain-containing protein [Alphaproteobacteria bacterium]|nr:EAL domain-containing protein [Alphaproteobacteria bacterium]
MTKRLMVVDDEEDICEIIADVAEGRGYEVAIVTDAEQVVVKLEKFTPDVIMLDLMMPGTDGVELLRVLADKAKQAKICLMSGSDSRVLNSARRLGSAHGLDVFGVFEKPIDIGTLRGALDQLAQGGDQGMNAADIAQAISSGQIVMYYQPIVEIATRKVFGFEALVRWNHPVRGILQPSDFLDTAAQDGMMEPIADFVIQAGVKEAAKWQSGGEELTVSMNITAGSLLDLSLPDRINDLCGQHKLPTGLVILEVTENEAMKDAKRTMDVLLRTRLRNIGVAIDDFGTGHSSLRELQRMPFSEMKIDKSFVMDMAGNKDCQVIVNSIIDLGHNLGLKTVAEGVEDARAWRLLAEKNCDMAQGFLIGRPMAATDIPGWLKGWREKPPV